MKQLILMIALTLAGTVGAVVISPFLGVAVYYLFAVLRPQALWQWSLPPGVAWSYYVALATILAALGRLLSGPRQAASRSEIRSGWHAGHVALLGFGFWVGVSYLMAFNTTYAFPHFIEYAKIFIMFAAAALLLHTIKQLWTLLIMAALALGYIAYEVNFEYLASGYLGIYTRGHGGLDNNGAGLALAMGIPLCFFLWEGTESRWRWLYLTLIPVLLHAVLLTYSRGAMVSLLATLPLVWLRSGRRRQLNWAILGLLLLLPFLAGENIRQRFFTVSEYDQDRSAQSRLESWGAAFEIARDHPIFGVGVRNADLFSHQYGADRKGRSIHNQYLQIAADMGFVGLGLYLTALGTTWWRLREVRRACRQRSDAAARRVLALAGGIECALAVFCVGGTFLSLDVFELPYLLLLLGAQLGTLATSPVAAPAPRPVVRTALATA